MDLGDNAGTYRFVCLYVCLNVEIDAQNLPPPKQILFKKCRRSIYSLFGITF